MLTDTQALAQTPLFRGVSEAALQVAREAFVARSYPAGKLIFEAGDLGAALYVVQSGKVRIYRTYFDGRERMFAYLGPGEVFGEMSLLDDQPRSASAEVVEDAVLLVLYQDGYWSLVRRYPEILHNLAVILAKRLREADLELEVLSFEEARGRVAYALIKLSRQLYNGGNKLRLTHMELAQLSGTSRETVTRVLHALRDEELVKLGSGSVELLDPTGLEEVMLGLR
jgi:CRP/FNR family cyclic AMP-dependent transcriptional regulator